MPLPSVEPVRHLFITYRPLPFPQWSDAFPSAQLLSYPPPGTGFAVTSGVTVVWLHIPAEITDLAERVETVKRRWPNSFVVILSNVPNDAEGLIAFSAGGVGYCSALATPVVLRQIAAVVEQGGLWVGRALMQRLFSAIAARRVTLKPAPMENVLSRRERQVAEAVARGSTNKEIARAMGITERTVKAHLSSIFDKMDVRDRLQLSLLVNGVERMAPVSHKISA